MVLQEVVVMHIFGSQCDLYRSLVVELSTLLDLDEDVVVDMTVLRDRISQCERWEKTLNDVLALELSKRRDLLRRGNDMIEAASREVLMDEC